MALPSDAGPGDLLCSLLSALSFSIGVVGACTLIDEGAGGIGTGGGGKTGGGINGTPAFSTIKWQKDYNKKSLLQLTCITWFVFVPYQWDVISNVSCTGCC